MNLNENFRSKLQTSLIDNSAFLKEKSIDVVNEAKDNFYNIIVENISDEYFPFKINHQRAIYNINKTLEIGPKLKLRNDDWAVFRENEIEFKIVRDEEPEFHSKEQLQYRVDSEDFLYECQANFWEDSQKNESYNKIADFSCCEDLEFPSNEFQKIRNKGNIFKIESWIEYIFTLVEINFPDFKYEKSKSNKKVRFLKTLNEEIEFGFEYDSLELKNQIKKNGIQLPNYFNIIIINRKFNVKEKKEYVFSYDNDIISLGILGNPFFYQPCYPLISFATIELYHYGVFYPDNTDPKKVRDYVYINNETMKIIHSDEYGEKLKKHAFFYMDLLGYSSKSYLEYLEKSISDIL